MRRSAALNSAVFSVLVVTLLAAGCGKKTDPVARPQPPAAAGGAGAADAGRPPAPPSPVNEPIVVPPEPAISSGDVNTSLDDINRNSPLTPVFFEYDSAEITSAGKTTLDQNASVLKKNATWAITIEGHTDERGTAEYNLALGERRAVAARAYLVSLGVSADRLRTVSYGKEFPFDAGKDEAAYEKNRRAHFVVTAR